MLPNSTGSSLLPKKAVLIKFGKTCLFTLKALTILLRRCILSHVPFSPTRPMANVHSFRVFISKRDENKKLCVRQTEQDTDWWLRLCASARIVCKKHFLYHFSCFFPRIHLFHFIYKVLVRCFYFLRDSRRLKWKIWCCYSLVVAKKKRVMIIL